MRTPARWTLVDRISSAAGIAGPILGVVIAVAMFMRPFPIWLSG